jgi:hypothetical protein
MTKFCDLEGDGITKNDELDEEHEEKDYEEQPK